jgi:hypothetical protein
MNRWRRVTRKENQKETWTKWMLLLMSSSPPSVKGKAMSNAICKLGWLSVPSYRDPNGSLLFFHPQLHHMKITAVHALTLLPSPSSSRPHESRDNYCSILLLYAALVMLFPVFSLSIHVMLCTASEQRPDTLSWQHQSRWKGETSSRWTHVAHDARHAGDGGGHVCVSPVVLFRVPHFRFLLLLMFATYRHFWLEVREKEIFNKRFLSLPSAESEISSFLSRRPFKSISLHGTRNHFHAHSADLIFFVSLLHSIVRGGYTFFRRQKSGKTYSAFSQSPAFVFHSTSTPHCDCVRVSGVWVCVRECGFWRIRVEKQGKLVTRWFVLMRDFPWYSHESGLKLSFCWNQTKKKLTIWLDLPCFLPFRATGTKTKRLTCEG